MNPNELTDEQKAKLQSCKDPAELQSMLNSMGIELTDEQLKKTCWGYMVYKKKVANMDNLPASFLETGRVLIMPDGTLADAE